MANIATIVAGLRVCPDVVTPVADRQMLEITMRDLVGIHEDQRIAGTNSLWIAFAQMGIQSFLGDLIAVTSEGSNTQINTHYNDNTLQHSAVNRIGN